MTEGIEETMQRYANRVAEYQLGLDWMRPCKPAVLTDKQAAKVRRDTYRWLRQEYPQRFPVGYRFS